MRVSSPAGQNYPIALDAATPEDDPPTMALIAPGDSSAGVQLSFSNGIVSGNPVRVVMQFKCTVRERKKHTHTQKRQLRRAVPANGR